MFILYNFIIFVFSILALPFFLLNKRGRIRILDRFGLWNLKGDYVWIHLASFGEAKGIRNFISLLLAKNYKLLVTATSPTAFEAVKDLDIEFRIIPFDFYLFYKIAFRNIRIVKTLIIEKEFWASLLNFAIKNSQVYFLNAKFNSERVTSFRRFPVLFLEPLKKVVLFLVQFESDQKCLAEFQIFNSVVNGNTKFDIKETNKIEIFDNAEPVLILSSIRKMEENYFIGFIKKYNLNVILAPRHTEDFEYFSKVLNANEIDFDRRSETPEIASKKVVLLDTLGELSSFYSNRCLVFVGGSLVPNFGGHNPLESIIAGSNVFMGKYYFNQIDLVEDLVKKHVLKIVESKEDIEEIIEVFLNDIQGRQHISHRSIEVAKEFNGASQRAYDWIFK